VLSLGIDCVVVWTGRIGFVDPTLLGMRLLDVLGTV
jgi:hypothetical protein